MDYFPTFIDSIIINIYYEVKTGDGVGVTERAPTTYPLPLTD